MQEAHLFQVSRDRLLADDSRPVVVIEGPSGYGKTLLAQAWLKRADAPQCGIWITLDAELRDPSVFLERLADELIGKQPQVEGGGLDESSLLSNRFSRITDQLSDSEHPIRLVFDDVHLVAGSEAANYIRRLLMAAGGPLKILITTQPVALDIGLADLVAKSKVQWISSDALRLTKPEIAQLAQCHGHELSERQVEWLAQSTNGWPAIVQLAFAIPIDSLPFGSGSTVAILGPVRDYIYEKFLNRLETQERKLLWMLSCVGPAQRSLFESIFSAHGDMEPILRHLGTLGVLQEVGSERSDPKIVLHGLVRETALRLFSAEFDAEKSGTVLAAATWLQNHGQGPAAVRLLLELNAAHIDVAREWLLLLGPEMVFGSGHHQTFVTLVNQWEHIAQRRDPALNRFATWALIFRRRFVLAEERIEDDADSRSGNAGGEAALQRSLISALRDDYEIGGLLAQQWLQRVSMTSSLFFQGTAWAIFGFQQKCLGDIVGAQASLRHSATAFGKSMSEYGLSWVHIVGALALIKQGQHRDALAEVGRGLDHCPDNAGLDGQRSMLLAIEAFIRYERNDLAVVREVLATALTSLPDQGIVDTIILGFSAAARARYADGNLGAALDLLSEGERCGDQRNFPRLTISLRSERALLLQRAGAPEQAVSVLQSAISATGSGAIQGLVTDRAGRVNARIAIADGRFDIAVDLLKPLIEHARKGRQQYKLCELLILLSLALSRQKHDVAADAALKEALELGSLENYQRIFIDEGSDLLALIGRWLKSQGAITRNKMAATWAEIVVGTSARQDFKEPVIIDGSKVVLNKRERQLLLLIDQGLSNSEIAARCFLVEGTVKWHLHNLYGKLNVQSRTAAIHAARALGLLSHR
ncbi:ATP-, maltotriose-and DNA-dependent transcriptional regulator MalT [Hydrocarboniphaga daqingensis]|uniref:ATP-, maltotriose-and DNA-dependent transcriptional regulator MalT n=1 Tax=Hydrocarboniphaga daqingensis TaxID=490188 RepID=A0A1M5R3F7_9GAMM|nr:LuxR C-terminal-related transcriptional regulator [Hydrocarboniphaga daqingensis]SHH20550.1 ATP-, maltotriose-and DNA-dependent transcriptional regulator MalT [Hydrocarboniphaga daqingensis]